MEINLYGVIIVAAIMLPNIIFAIRCKDGFENKNIPKSIEMLEQIGRFGCIAFMVIRIPRYSFASCIESAFTMYVAICVALVGLYWLIWVLCRKRHHLFRALSLSILPSVLFLYQGIMSGSVLLIVSALVFAPNHIYISYKNTL